MYILKDKNNEYSVYKYLKTVADRTYIPYSTLKNHFSAKNTPYSKDGMEIIKAKTFDLTGNYSNNGRNFTNRY